MLLWNNNPPPLHIKVEPAQHHIQPPHKATSYSSARPKKAPAWPQAEENWLLRPHGSKLLPIGKALHKWEAPALPRKWLAEAGIIPLHQGTSIPTGHHPSVWTDFTSAMRHRGMICISWTGIWGRGLGSIDWFLYKLQLYSLAPWSQKSQRGTLPVAMLEISRGC